MLDERASETARAEAVARLVLLDPVESGSVLVKLLDPREPPAVQVSAVRGLAEIGSADAGGILLPRLRGFEPSVRSAAVQTMLSRADWTRRSRPSAAMVGRAAWPVLIQAADRAPLLSTGMPGVAARRKLFGKAPADSRARVISDYSTAVRAGGDRAGVRSSSSECKACHKIGEQGFELGPDLTGSPSRDPAALLSNILDPNASVPPKDVQYVLVDQNGRTYSGLIASQTATSLTLKRGDGAQDTILRGQVAELSSTGLSLMPEGFEKRVSKPEMADLIAFLRASHRGGDNSDEPVQDDKRPLDIGTLPDLIEPDE